MTKSALVGLAAIQRMRRLRQLGLAYLAFPSAEHSRFTHALGALAVGERVFATLRAHSPEFFADERDFTTQRRLLRASLLLHDVGHGPFSHACEAVLGRRHETRTAAILALPEVHQALADMDLDSFEVLSLVAGGPTRYPVLRELVSGPNLDCDRMDYLLARRVLHRRRRRQLRLRSVDRLAARSRRRAVSRSWASTAAASSRSNRSCSRAT